MKRFDPERFREASKITAGIQAALSTGGGIAEGLGKNPNFDKAPLPDSLRQETQRASNIWIDECEQCEMELPTIAARRIGEARTIGELSKAMADLDLRLSDQMGLMSWYVIEPGKQHYVSNQKLFGEEVEKAFISASFDIEEAGKCLAFNRATASVFHLMRVMEVCLDVVASTLNDPTINPKTNPSWQRIINRFQTELNKPLNQRSKDWQADEPFFSGVAVRITAVKDAWRNPTMHVVGTYTEEQALDVWHHVRSFTQHLATKLSESP